jgi:xylan 1,4-beta-xylosidase
LRSSQNASRHSRLFSVSTVDVGLEAIIKSGVRGAPDVAALASLDTAKRQVAVLVWHYHDDDVAGPDAAVALALAGLPAGAAHTARVTHYRVDEKHSNAYAGWKSLGSPVAPTRPQYTQLEAAAQLAPLTDAPASVAVTNGTAQLDFTLPRQGVSLVLVAW